MYSHSFFRNVDVAVKQTLINDVYQLNETQKIDLIEIFYGICTLSHFYLHMIDFD